MKRILLFVILLITAAANAYAQKGLAVNDLFNGRYRSDSQAVETTISGDRLKAYKLTKYRSIMVTGRPEDAAIFEKALETDARKAIESETSYKDGKLFYAFLRLPGESDENRYLLYVNQHLCGGENIVLMYLQGYLSTSDVKKMIKK